MQNPSQNIQNKKTEVPNLPQLNDRDYVNIILSTCKRMVNSYATALSECSNETYYNMLYKIFEETSLTQRRIFNLMFRKGWYTLESESQQKISQTIQKETANKQQLQ